MHRFSVLLKCIGIFLFVGILTRIDLRTVFGYYRQADVLLLCAGLGVLFGVLATKAWRWHMLAEAAGARRRWMLSWREFMIGVFLSTFTPAKLGDFGKIAYLKQNGVGGKTGALLVVMERMADVIILLPLAALSAAILSQTQGLWIGLLATITIALMLALVARFWNGFEAAIRYCVTHHALKKVLLSTLAAWVLHFLWAICIARGLGISTPVPVLFAALTVASILNALPISPSGLGTREAALLAVLIPYGVEAEHVVALSTMMLLQLIILAIIGGWYWIRGVKRNIHVPSALQ